MDDDSFTTRASPAPNDIVQAELVEADNHWPVIAVKASVEAAASRPANQPFGVPTRFGIGTLLVVTAAYGALLALLRALDWDPRAIVWMVVFVSLVGLGQMLLFGSRRPREASLLAGAVCLPAITIFTLIVHRVEGQAPQESGCVLISALFFGAPAGYLAGGVVAGVFLMMDAVQRWLGRFSLAKRCEETEMKDER